MTIDENSQPTPYLSSAVKRLRGEVTAPGDKSLSHRALMIGSQRLGRLRIDGLLEGDDILCTMRSLQACGVKITRLAQQSYEVSGVGIGGLQEPEALLDMGNSGTGARLMMGLLAPYPFRSFFAGDKSLSKRPMGRVLEPLQLTGMQMQARSGNRLPVMIYGISQPLAFSYRSPVASAQVKSALMLAALNIAGQSTIIEPVATRDHSERMLKHFGFAVTTQPNAAGETEIRIKGHQQPAPSDAQLSIAGDPSSAAFMAVAAAIVPESEVLIRHVGTNPLRVGIYEWLSSMGADLQWENPRDEAGEPVADLRVRYAPLKAVDIPPEAAPSMIDEYPVLAMAAACAKGTSRLCGLHELRVKESDRLQAVYDGLIACGINAAIDGDDLIIEGNGGRVAGNASIATHFDHRIAMSFLVLGLVAQQPIRIDDGRAIATSFPNFFEIMQALGAVMSPERRRNQRGSNGRRLVIAIDGPAASGKGTLARRLARHLNLPYLDTGSLYRAVAWHMLQAGIEHADEPAALRAVQAIEEEDLNDPELRQERVGQLASVISAMPPIRQALLDYQRYFAASPRGAVLDGRDIGTIICPDADIKLFMTASVEARAQRRVEQLQAEGLQVSPESVLAALKERDARDEKRDHAPLVAAVDAVAIDTTNLSIDEVFHQVLLLLQPQAGEKTAIAS